MIPAQGGAPLQWRAITVTRPHREIAMKAGLFINTQFPEGDPVAARVPGLVARVRAAREGGFA